MVNRLLLLFTSALFFMAALPFPPPRASAATPLLVVIVTARSAMTDISPATLRRVFSGVSTDFENGKRFVPLNHPTGTSERKQFDRIVLGLEPDAVGAYWIDRRIRDESPPPRTVPSVSLAVRVVAAIPGAITYVRPESVTTAVKVLTIDGKSPGQRGYLLD